MTTTGTNNLIRFAIFLGLSLGFFFLGAFNVSANTFSDILVGYGYTPVTNGVSGSRAWSNYSSNNLVNYGYNMSDSYYYEIDEFNIRFRPTGGYSKGNTYTITFTWYNGHPNPDITDFYTDWLLMTHSLYCYYSSWSNGQTGSNCFDSSNITATQGLNSSIIVTITFTPNTNLYGVNLVNQHGSTVTFYKSVGWEVYDASYSYSSNGSQDIINNQNQNTQNIINNQNSNTQDIIDNQNQNTQDIIDNQNQNAQDIINSNEVCEIYDAFSSLTRGFINSGGSVTDNTSWFHTDYIPINSNLKLHYKSSIASVAPKSCFYNSSKGNISCFDLGASDIDITIPNNARFVRFSINKGSFYPTYTICKNGSQAISDSLNDSNVDSSTSSADNFFSNFTTETYGLTSVITAPLSFIQSLTSKTCSPLTLPLPYVNRNLELPCMTTIYQQHFGTFLTMYQTITFGIVSYWVIVRIFNLVKDFKNPDHDEIEVMDL